MTQFHFDPFADYLTECLCNLLKPANKYIQVLLLSISWNADRPRDAVTPNRQSRCMQSWTLSVMMWSTGDGRRHRWLFKLEFHGTDTDTDTDIRDAPIV